MYLFSSLKSKLKQILLKSFWSYDSYDLGRMLVRSGIAPGDVIMIHASWLPDNGFSGSPKDFLETIKKVLTPAGLLIMTSLPYVGESSREFLLRGGVLKLKTSPSRMGLLSEVMRRGRSTYRSISPTHPLIAWGHGAKDFVRGHECTEYPFGEDSPFGKLAFLNAKILVIDAHFNTITYTHYLEHCVRAMLPGELYDGTLYIGKVVDYGGNEHALPVRVLAANSLQMRLDDKLQRVMLARHLIKNFRIGNTRFQLMRCRDMVSCAEDMSQQGKL